MCIIHKALFTKFQYRLQSIFYSGSNRSEKFLLQNTITPNYLFLLYLPTRLTDLSIYLRIFFLVFNSLSLLIPHISILLSLSLQKVNNRAPLFKINMSIVFFIIFKATGTAVFFRILFLLNKNSMIFDLGFPLSFLLFLFIPVCRSIDPPPPPPFLSLPPA